jgi:hypothetical protein
MNKDISHLARNYLIESFNKHSTGDLHEEFLREFGEGPSIAVDAYKKTQVPKVPTTGYNGLIGGRYKAPDLDPEASKKKQMDDQNEIIKNAKIKSPFGVGGGRGGKSEGASDDGDLDMDKVLFGATEKDDLGKYSAVGAYALGSSLDWMGKLLGNKASSIGGGVLKKIPVLNKVPGAIDSLLGQAADISGSSWFDANIGKIGQNAQNLAAQGAGSPWVPLVGSKRAAFKPEDPLDARRRAVSQRQLEAQEKAYGITP